jgi:uncharacterized protein YrrD
LAWRTTGEGERVSTLERVAERNSKADVPYEPLKNKVALLLDGATEEGHSLALSLAERGADMAIIYRQANAFQARETRRLVEAAGRKCVIVPAHDDLALSKEALLLATSQLGRLDIFIDFSSPPKEDDESPANARDVAEKNNSVEYIGPFTNLEIISAALDQIMQADLIEDQESVPNTSIRSSNEEMRVSQELMNKPVISVNEGREVGKVQGFYLDQNLTRLTAINLGSEGLLSRKENLVKWPDVVTLGEDAVLIKDANCVMNTAEMAGIENMVSRDEISGRAIDTPGGTKIGQIGDIVIDEKAAIIGFALSRSYVAGPIADNRAISRKAVIDIGNEDDVMTADMKEAEKAELQIVYEGFFAEPSVSPTQEDEAVATAD